MMNYAPSRALSTLLLLLLATNANPETGSAPTAGPEQRILETAAYLGGLPALSVDIEMEFNIVGENGDGENVLLKGSIAISGEDDARYRLVSPDETMEIYSAEDERYFHLVTQKKYVNASMMDSRREVLMAIPSGPFRGAQMILADILHNSENFHRAIERGTVEQRENSSMPETHQFHLKDAGLACDFWIDAGQPPLLRKLALDLSEAAAQAGQNLDQASVIYTLSNWNLEPEFAEGYFDFEIPEGVTEFEAPQREMASGKLLGEPAPNVSLPLLGGGTLDLAALKGENIVILDFWATWCGPCRVGLPIVSKVAERYKDKGVLFYAVNVAEDSPTIEAFLEQTGFEMTVALDTERVAQRAYGADGIPTTVVIDRQGIVRDYHAGVSPTLESDLDGLLKSLTE